MVRVNLLDVKVFMSLDIVKWVINAVKRVEWPM